MDDNGNFDELKQYEKQITESGMHEEAKEKAFSELKKLKGMPPMSSEATVSRHYIDTLIGLPWHKRTRTTKKLAKAQEVMDYYNKAS